MGYFGLALALGVGVLLAAGRLYDLPGRLSASSPAVGADRPGAEPGVAVEAARVATGTVVEDINVVGTLRPNEVTVIQPEIGGRIVRFGFTDGVKVRKGDVLVELDPAILKAELAKARSDLVLARTNHDRARMLAGQGTGTLRARDESLAVLQAAQANNDLAEARLERATIRAPFSGVAGFRMFSLGAYVAPGDQVVEIADSDPIRADFRVSEIHLSRLRTGQKIAVKADALPGRTFAGEIFAIHPLVDENGRALRLRARIPNPDGTLYPGLFVRVRIVVEQRPDALLVPEAAIFPIDQKKFVYRVADGRAHLTEVEIGHRGAGSVEILGGLGRDATVVTAGQQRLRDGTPVEIVASRAGGRT